MQACVNTVCQYCVLVLCVGAVCWCVLVLCADPVCWFCVLHPCAATTWHGQIHVQHMMQHIYYQLRNILFDKLSKHLLKQCIQYNHQRKLNNFH